MAKTPPQKRTSTEPPVEAASAWLRPTTLAAFVTALAAFVAAVYPIMKDRQQSKSGVLDTESGRVSALNFGCSATVEVDSKTARTVRLEVGVGRYPISIQVFFKPDPNDNRSFQMFPLPSPQLAVNPMNIYTDGSAVLMSIVGGQSLFARFDPATNGWDEFDHGYVYACALF